MWIFSPVQHSVNKSTTAAAAAHQSVLLYPALVYIIPLVRQSHCWQMEASCFLRREGGQRIL